MLKRRVNKVKENSFEKGEKGLSTIVATLLIILLTLVAVGIIWVVVRNVIQGGAEQISLGKFTLDLEIKNIVRDNNNNSMDIKIKRNAGAGELSGIAFISESQVSTEIVKITNLSFKQLEERTFNVDLTNSTNVSDLEKVSIAPIFISNSGEEIVGDIVDEYVFSDNPFVNETICISNCSGRVCGLDPVCGQQCGTNCSTGYNCSLTGQCACILSCDGINCCSTGQVCNLAEQCVDSISLSWMPNSRINNSLYAVFSTSSNPFVFYKDSSWYLINGKYDGTFYGYTWDGLQWVFNSTITLGLTDVGDMAAPSIFYKDSSWYMVVGRQDGGFSGFVWNGNNWIANSTISLGLSSIGVASTPSVFYKDSSWYLISGAYDGRFYSYVWSGTQWISNSTISLGLPDLGDQSNPFVFYKNSSWYLISGEWGGGFYGYAWNGTQWKTNLTINASLSYPGFSSSPSIFYKSNYWYLISGNTWGSFYGFIYGDNSSGCIADCSGRFCGNDGCGGSCGTCLTGYDCNSIGQCVVPVPIWRPNSTINSSLNFFGDSAHTTFYKDSSLYFIGTSGGGFYGYVWNGTNWKVNLTINASLPSVSNGYSAPSVFQKNGAWYLLTGDYDGDLLGFVWDNGGNHWHPNSTINASLSEMQFTYMTTPAVFYKDSSWYLLCGEYYGRFYGFVWDNGGNHWHPNSTINASLPDVGGRSVPSVFYKDSNWYMVAGRSVGDFLGYIWNGISWETNSAIVENLPNVGPASTPSVFQIGSNWYMIGGESDSYSFKGFVFN